MISARCTRLEYRLQRFRHAGRDHPHRGAVVLGVSGTAPSPGSTFSMMRMPCVRTLATLTHPKIPGTF